MVNIPVGATAFAVFDMQELSAETFDAGLESAADELAVVFFWGFECFNCEIAKKAMLAKPDEIQALGLKWFHSNVYYEHRDLDRRFMLHGVPTWFFFHRGKRLGRATGWYGLGQFEAAVAAAREKIRALEAKS
ncbi:MAG: Thiol-disulfide isomerase and thioredoxins [uncultured Caballeronia sp.]|nr:MAG: Thiol-disulfide isomerase and thioredoxins [uncultured Caballeronia sp.]